MKVTNLNFKPEKHGDELKERADMSLEVLLEADDIDDIVDTRGNPLQALWSKTGEPNLRELDTLALAIKAEGTCSLGSVHGDTLHEFEGAVLKKVVVEPMMGHKATMRCQVRVDPTGRLEDLADLVIAEQALFAFSGGQMPPEASKQNSLEV